MFDAIRTLINQETIKTIHFSSPKGMGNTWLPQRQMEYKGSEYQMVRESQAPLKSPAHAFSFRLASMEDIDLICHIDSVCFLSDPNDMRAHFINRLTQSSYLIYLIYDQEEPIGKAHLNQQANTVYLSDIGIIPERQRQGIGRILMAHCINLLLKKGHKSMTLNVETGNDHALHLYQHLGFSLKNAHDYWSMRNN